MSDHALESPRYVTDLHVAVGSSAAPAEPPEPASLSPRYVPNLRVAMAAASGRLPSPPPPPPDDGNNAPLILTVHIPFVNAIKKLKFNPAATVATARVVIDDALRSAALLDDTRSLSLFRDKDDARSRLDEAALLASYALKPMESVHYLVTDSVPVRESEAMKKARHAAAVISEVLQTEADYVGDLELAISRVLVPARDRRLNLAAELADVFRNLEQLAALHGRFLGELRTAKSAERVCETFVRHLPRWSEPLGLYIASTDSSSAALRRLREQNVMFEQLVSDFEGSDDVRRKGDIDSFLFKPVQRVCKYPLLLRELEKCCDGGSPLAAAAHAAQEVAAALTKRVNRTRNEAEQAARFAALVPRLHEAPSDLLQPKRVLVRDQELMVVLKKGARASRLVVLFNDLMLVAHIVKADRYEVAELFDLDGGCYVTEVRSDKLRHGFAVVKFDTAATRAVIECATDAERDGWVADIRRAQCALPRGSAASVVAAGGAGSAAVAESDADDELLVARVDPIERKRTKAALLLTLVREEREFLAWMRVGLRAVKAWNQYATLAGLAPEARESLTASRVFGNVVQLTRIHKDFLDALEKRIASGERHVDDLLPRGFYAAHVDYMANFSSARKTLRDEEMMSSEFFKVCDAALKQDPDVLLSFEQMVTAPIDRMQAHAVFLKGTLACTDTDSPQYASMHDTLSFLIKHLKETRKALVADEDMSALLAVVNSFSGAEEVPLVRRGRRIQHESVVKLIIDGDAKHPVQRRMYTCNDCLILATGKDGKPLKKLANGTWQFVRLLDLRQMLIRDHHNQPNSFELVLLSSDKRSSLIVETETLSESKTLQNDITANIKALIKQSLKK
jgi:hypothetical protein